VELLEVFGELEIHHQALNHRIMGTVEEKADVKEEFTSYKMRNG
jgi:hypothetical protein